MDAVDINNRFAYHKPTGGKTEYHESVRHHCELLANIIDELVPDGREKSTAITKLEEAMFWANAGIARNPEVEVAGDGGQAQ